MSDPCPDSLWRLTLQQVVNAAPLDSNVTADLVIIGGGFTGVSAALHAAAAGADVRLLEARDIGHGGSGRNAGLVNAGLWLPPETISARLGSVAAERLNSLLAGGPELVFSLIEQYGINCEATRAGTLHLAHSPAGLADLRDRYRQFRALDAPVALIDAAQTTTRTGSDRFHGALFDPRAGTIQPLAYCHGLAAAAQAAGARLHVQTPASTIRQTGSQWLIETPRGKLNAAALLLATDAYHVDAIGVPAPDRVLLNYFQLATEVLPQPVGNSILPGGEGCWDTARIITSFRRDAAGRLIVGGVGSLEHAGRQIHRKWAKRKLANLFPSLAIPPIQQAWSGRIAMTSDQIPKIVSLGNNGLSLFGYSGRGIAPGTLFGRAAAHALSTGDYSGLPLAPIERHREAFRWLRQGCYETAATAYHLLRS